MKFRHLILFLFYGFHLIAQENTTLISSSPLKADSFIGLDQYNNLFYTFDNIIYKNKAKASYSNFQLGELTSVDISNPFKIVLFYKDFNTVVLVDNNLNETDRVIFDFNVSFVKKSNKNRLWVLNRDLNQLEIYNFKSKTTELKTAPFTFNTIGMESNLNAVFIQSVNTIYKYDYMGNIEDTTDLNISDKFKVLKDKLLFCTKNKLYTLVNNNKKELIFHDKEIVDFQVRNDEFYIFDGTHINHFRIDKKQ
jgi:hypothetical protein